MKKTGKLFRCNVTQYLCELQYNTVAAIEVCQASDSGLQLRNISAQPEVGLFQILGPPPLGEEWGHLSSLMKIDHNWPQSVKGAPMRQATRNPTPKLPKAGGREL